MKRNCNLELRLVTPSVSFHFADRNGGNHHSMLDAEEDESRNKTQQLTIFYNGKIACCDATELQARAIISLARREMEEKSSKNNSPGTPYSPLLLNSPVYGAATGLSMKRSLQRFLEKRKSRAQSISPYGITRQSHH